MDRPAAGEEVRMALDSGADMAARCPSGTGYIDAGSEERWGLPFAQSGLKWVEREAKDGRVKETKRWREASIDFSGTIPHRLPSNILHSRVSLRLVAFELCNNTSSSIVSSPIPINRRHRDSP